MKKYEILELLQKYYSLDRDESTFSSVYISKDMIVKGCGDYVTIFDRGSEFGVILTVDKSCVKFRVFIQSGTKSYIAKIYNYDNTADNLKKEISIEDIYQTYSKFLVKNEAKHIISELDRLLIAFKDWDINVYSDSNIKNIHDLEKVSSRTYEPHFSIEDFAFAFVDKNPSIMIGVESISKDIAILEYSSTDNCCYMIDGKCPDWEARYHLNNIDEIQKYLESKNVKITTLKTMFSHIMLLDLSNKDTTLDPFDEYNLWFNKK